MLVYKTIVIPSTVYNYASKKEMQLGISNDTLKSATSPINDAIKEHAKNGWAFHFISSMQQRLARKKTLLEKIFGWFPIIGPACFPSMKTEC